MIKEDIENRACRDGLSVVIPVYNEAGIIGKVIEDFHAKVIRQRPGSRLIVMEDGSDDGTKNILENLHCRIPFTLISAEKRKGYTRAFKDALKTADTERVLAVRLRSGKYLPEGGQTISRPPACIATGSV